MELNEIKELLDMIQESGVEEFEMEKAGVRLRIRNSRPLRALGGQPATPAVFPDQPADVAPGAGEAEGTAQPKPADEEFHLFRAPIVGTFYVTPKPDAEPFVQVGDYVTKNSVVCIIEAMKIFNQIECDVSGEIVAILVENGQPVEYGEPLLKIRCTAES